MKIPSRIETLKELLERSAFGVCDYFADKLGVATSRVRLTFIYLSFLASAFILPCNIHTPMLYYDIGMQMGCTEAVTTLVVFFAPATLLLLLNFILAKNSYNIRRFSAKSQELTRKIVNPEKEFVKLYLQFYYVRV